MVTGHDEAGRAIFVDDRQVDPVTVSLLPGAEYHRMWGANETASFPDDGAPRPSDPFFPPVGGYRVLIFTLPPAGRRPGVAAEDRDAALAEMEERLPGARSHFEARSPGMHTTASVDFEVVLEGEVWLELDDGAEVLLTPGDTVVQNGTRHAWHNRSDAPARLVAFLVGAHHANVAAPR